ncbi:MAG: hypothetical protein PHN55_08820 [Dysgonamonadaceae bacterium]|nr:hypothetical protein [Dysgonamonadaceae bacterium]
MSLSFAQKTQALAKPLDTGNMNPGNISFGIQSANTFGTINITNTFNNQFNDIYANLNSMRQDYQQKVNELLVSGNSPIDSMRDKGVELAWKYERVELQMGGDGTRNWGPEQSHEILEKGRARYFEGHHINSVGNNPALQANPDNVEFLEEHRKGDGVREHFDKHGRNWQNQTDGDLINRNDRLEKANDNRVFKNELEGIGTAVAIGLGIGFTLGFVVSLAQSGVSSESLKNATVIGVKTGMAGAALGVINHLFVRSIGEMATNALQGVAGNLGLVITENIRKMCNMAAFGGMAIVIFSVYQFVKLNLLGYGTKECLLRIGKSAAFSATIILMSLVAQWLWGGYAGIIVSISIGVIVLTYRVIGNQHNERIGELIRHYIIQKCEPVLVGV